MSDVDWSKTKAFSVGAYFGRIYFNLEGREPEGIVGIEEYDELQKKVDEQEFNKKSELEKSILVQNDLKLKLETQEQKLQGAQKSNLRNEILMQNEFVSMPRAYKNMVKLSLDVEEVKRSAGDVFEEYKKDMSGIAKEQPKSFGVPIKEVPADHKDTKTPVKDAQELAASLRAIIQNKIRK